MRFLDVRTRKLHTFYGDEIPPYAILSHTWGNEGEEVNFAQIQIPSQSIYYLPGHRKFEFLCQQAAADNFDYAWIDKCCIDKSSSVELSEAINSTYTWYSRSDICYVYLSGIGQSNGGGLLSGRWWTRSWTLQELVAPSILKILDKNRVFIGEKADLASIISVKTGVDEKTLKTPEHLFFKSIAQRLSWASSREATRIEDVSYSLLGILRINMSLQYGEAEEAFIRLQQELIKQSNGQSLFAWGFSPQTIHNGMGRVFAKGFLRKTIEDMTETNHALKLQESNENDAGDLHLSHYGVFAASPRDFKNCGNIIFHHRFALNSPITEINGATHMEMLMCHGGRDWLFCFGNHLCLIGLLPCGLQDANHDMIGILLRNWGSGGRYQRISPGSGFFTFLIPCGIAALAEEERVCINKSFQISQFNYPQSHQSRLQYSVTMDAAYTELMGYHFIGALPRAWAWDEENSTLLYRARRDPLGCMIFGFFCKEKENVLCIFLEIDMDDCFRHVGAINLISLPATDMSKTRVLEDAVRDAKSSSGWTNSSSIGMIKASCQSRRIFNQVILTVNFYKAESDTQ